MTGSSYTLKADPHRIQSLEDFEIMDPWFREDDGRRVKQDTSFTL